MFLFSSCTLCLVLFCASLPLASVAFDIPSPLNTTRFHCGNSFAEKMISVLGLAMMCPLGSAGIQRCCGQSQICYENEAERNFCEDVFCECVTEVVTSTEWCSPEILTVSCSNSQLGPAKNVVKNRPSTFYTPSWTVIGYIGATFAVGWFMGVIINTILKYLGLI
ncbi:hypothetical protein L596_028463 [Steinernema carpocapsae]|uniref:Extracellular membrane protein CFEM domain-containing protein n=1 Tax=Steinernema carpocapsae TaxID=34508 RepID=A0A4V5ZXW3_STECR|nr:hypothetical protein L596_028463 [Steinernema carpocapsae]